MNQPEVPTTPPPGQESPPPQQTPLPEPAPAPPPGTPQLSIDQLTEAMVNAYRSVVPAAPMTPPPAARDWMETLTPAQRENLNNQFLTDGLTAARFVADQSAAYARQQIIGEAAPLIASQGNTIVELYKTRKMGQNDPLNADTMRLFDAKLQGINLAPLVGMNRAQQDYELDLRWNAAYGEVARKRQAAMPAPKPEPLLLAQNGLTGAPLSRKIENDPYLSQLAKQYNFTPEQIKEVEEAM